MATMTMDFGPSVSLRSRHAHTPIRLTARGQRLVGVLLMVAAAAAAFAVLSVGRVAVSALSAPPAAVVVDHSVVVKSGETLWQIASRELPGTDPRDGIARIRTVNGMEPTDTLVAGQPLAIPAA